MSRARRRTPYLLGLLAILLYAPHFVWLATGGGREGELLLGNLLYTVPSLSVAAIVLAVAARQRGRVGRGWLFIGLGLSAQAVGDSFWGYFEVVAGTDPFLSVADLFYLLFGPLFAAALVYLMPTPCNRLEGVKLALDVTVTVGAAGLFFWRFLLAPLLTQEMDSWTTAVSLAYPLLDLLLLGLLVFIALAGARNRLRRPGLLLLVLGVVSLISADLFYSTASLTTPDTPSTRSGARVRFFSSSPPASACCPLFPGVRDLPFRTAGLRSCRTWRWQRVSGCCSQPKRTPWWTIRSARAGCSTGRSWLPRS